MSAPADWLEGRHALAEALSSGAPVTSVYVSESALRDPSLAATLDAARDAGASIEVADAAFLSSHSSHGAHQGVTASLAPYRYATLADLVAACEGLENALVIACDHITDAGNFGAIARTAEVCGAAGLLIASRRQAQVSPGVYKTSAGAVSHLRIAREANLAASLERLKGEGFWVVGASEHAEDVAFDADLSGRVVLVVGAEDRGLARLTRERCDLLVRLPQAGHVGSLNVAQAATALSFEWMRQCREKAAPAAAAAPAAPKAPDLAAAPDSVAPPDSPPAPAPQGGAS